jgi:hypothetical protein
MERRSQLCLGVNRQRQAYAFEALLLPFFRLNRVS